MRIIIIIAVFCVINGEHDHVKAETGSDRCGPIAPSLTAKRSGRKAHDKCIDYQEMLVYPCVPTNTSNSSAVGQGRANHCQINKEDVIRGNKPSVPHLAMLGFGEPLSRVGWLCGATLVSEKYLLAPANCKDLFGDIAVSYARIGVEDLRDSSPEKTFKIKSVTTYPGYQREMKYNDIALFELDQPVSLSAKVMPACLPVEDNLKDDEVLFSYWDAKRILQKRIRHKVAHEDCSKKFPPMNDLPDGINSTTLACYEDKTYSETGTCVDTLGGPIQVLNGEVDCMFTVTGMAAFSDSCPYDIYAFTKIGPYVPWIESVVWPEPGPKRTESLPKNENNFSSSIHVNRNCVIFFIFSILLAVIY